MNDLEICKRIAEIEEIYAELIEHHGSIYYDSPPFQVEFNPLTDDALCFRLMINYELELEVDSDDGYTVWYVKENKTGVWKEYLCNKSPNKAICLAVIAMHEED